MPNKTITATSKFSANYTKICFRILGRGVNPMKVTIDYIFTVAQGVFTPQNKFYKNLKLKKPLMWEKYAFVSSN